MYCKVVIQLKFIVFNYFVKIYLATVDLTSQLKDKPEIKDYFSKTEEFGYIKNKEVIKLLNMIKKAKILPFLIKDSYFLSCLEFVSYWTEKI